MTGTDGSRSGDGLGHARDDNRSFGIRPWRRGEDEALERWLRADRTATIYATPTFLRFVERVAGGEGTLLVAEHEGQYAGCLSWCRLRTTGGWDVVNSLPWYGSHGGCQVPVDERCADRVRGALIDAYKGGLEGLRLLSATMVLTPAETERLGEYRRRLSPGRLEERSGQCTEFPVAAVDREAALTGILRQKTRNLVRKALRQGFGEAVTSEEWAWRFLHEVHVENMRALGGRPKPWSHMEAIRDGFPPSWQRLSVAMCDGEAIAALLLLRFNRTVEYLVPVIRLAYRSRQPLSFLIWRAMLDAMSEGYERWNWGGTWLGQESLHHFKAGWGAWSRPYSYLVCTTDEGLDELRRGIGPLRDEAPYYYLYPYEALERE